MFPELRMLHQDQVNGRMWGDSMLEVELKVLSRMTDNQRKALNAKILEEDKAREAGIISYTVDLRKKLYTNADGVAKRKFRLPCKREDYTGGCWLHNEKKGSCSFIHKDEHDFYKKIFDAMHVPEHKCIWVTGVDEKGDLTFSKTNPEYKEEKRSPREIKSKW